MKCIRCKNPKSCHQQKCIPCRQAIAAYRLLHIDKEKQYQSNRWAYRCVVHSRLADRKAQRDFTEEYITPVRLQFIRGLQQNKCIYCRCEMQTLNRKMRDGLTIERIDNSKAHITKNCVLSCHQCNMRTSRRHYVPIIQHVFGELLQKIYQTNLYNNKIERCPSYC